MWERSSPGPAPEPRPNRLWEHAACTSTHCVRHGTLLHSVLPNPWAQLLCYPHLTRKRTGLKEVNCSDLETLLVSGIAGFDPRSVRCHSPAHSPLPPLPGLPFAPSLGHIPAPGLDWCLPSGTCSPSCLLLFFPFRVLGYLLLLEFQLIGSHPATEHRKVSHSHSEAFLLCTGAAVTLVTTLSFILFGGESPLVLQGNTI